MPYPCSRTVSPRGQGVSTGLETDEEQALSLAPVSLCGSQSEHSKKTADFLVVTPKKDAHARYVANEKNSGDQSRRLILQAPLKDTVISNEPHGFFRWGMYDGAVCQKCRVPNHCYRAPSMASFNPRAAKEAANARRIQPIARALCNSRWRPVDANTT